jgi:hypothetical protein
VSEPRTIRVDLDVQLPHVAAGQEDRPQERVLRPRTQPRDLWASPEASTFFGCTCFALVSQTFASWNQIREWLRRLEAFRQVA